MKVIAVASSALLIAALFGASPACAFTVETLSNGNPDGSPRFTDPDEQAPVQRFTDPSTGTSGYSWTSPHLNLSITRQPSGASTPFLDPGRNPYGGPALRSDPFGTRAR